jgi:DNA gyrase/topoisomerase IV subunit B
LDVAQEFHEARRKSLEDSKAAFCASKPDLSSFEARLAFSEAFLEARLAALKAENPKLIAFSNSLDAKQKEKFYRSGTVTAMNEESTVRLSPIQLRA